MLAANARVAATVNGDGPVHYLPLIWFKLLLRLRQLPDGVHSLTLVKEGDSLRWGVQHSAKLEG